MAVVDKHSPQTTNTESTAWLSRKSEASSSEMSTDKIAALDTGNDSDPNGCDMDVECGETPDPNAATSDDMDIDIIAVDGISDETGSVLQDGGEMVKGKITSDEEGDDDGNEDGETEAMQGEYVAKATPAVATAPAEHMAKATPAVATAPAEPKPIRYLKGKQVSEYEWDRNERIKENKIALAALGLDNAGERTFGKRGEKKGKENGRMGHGPSKKQGRNLPSANVEKRELRSLGKAIPNRSVSVIKNDVSLLTCPKC